MKRLELKIETHQFLCTSEERLLDLTLAQDFEFRSVI